MGILKKMKNEKGLAMVEFAIVAPLLFVILFGIIEFGLLMYDKAVLTNACREGARQGIVYFDGRTIGGVETIAKNGVTFYYENNYLFSFDENATIEPTATASGTVSGASLTVTVTYPYKFLLFSGLMKLVGGNPDGSITLSAESVMRLE